MGWKRRRSPKVATRRSEAEKVGEQLRFVGCAAAEAFVERTRSLIARASSSRTKVAPWAGLALDAPAGRKRASRGRACGAGPRGLRVLRLLPHATVAARISAIRPLRRASMLANRRMALAALLNGHGDVRVFHGISGYFDHEFLCNVDLFHLDFVVRAMSLFRFGPGGEGSARPSRPGPSCAFVPPWWPATRGEQVQVFRRPRPMLFL